MEQHIRTISEMIAKQLTGTGLMWTHYLQTCTYAFNSFASPALNDIKSISVNLQYTSIIKIIIYY